MAIAIILHNNYDGHYVMYIFCNLLVKSFVLDLLTNDTHKGSSIIFSLYVGVQTIRWVEEYEFMYVFKMLVITCW